MELDPQDMASSETFLSAFDTLMGDKRTQRTFQGVIQGIIAGESLRAAVIARFSPYYGSDGECRAEGQAHGRRGKHPTQPAG